MPQLQQEKVQQHNQRSLISLFTIFSYSSPFQHSRKDESTYILLNDGCRGTIRCFSTGNDDGIVDAEDNSRVRDGNFKSEKLVYYTLSINGQLRRIMKVKVNIRTDIDSIIDEIKKKNNILLSSVDPEQLEIFKSKESSEPLDALEEWNPNVSWGTKAQPLIVKVNPSNKSGKSTHDDKFVTRCFITGNDDDIVDAAVENDRKETTKYSASRKSWTPQVTVDHETNAIDPTNVRRAGFVYETVDGLRNRELKIEVMEGDDVYSIRDKIKEKKKNAYTSYNVDELILFHGNQTVSTEPLTTGIALSASEEWNPNVSWGTKAQPLIVKVNPSGKLV